MTEAFLSVEDLNTEDEQFAYEIRDLAASLGLKALGGGSVVIAFMFGLLAAIPSMAFRRRRTGRNSLIFTFEALAFCCITQAKSDYPQVLDSYTAFTVANTLSMMLVAVVLWRIHQAPVKALSLFTPTLPPLSLIHI